MLHRFVPVGKNVDAAPLLFKVTCLVGLSWQMFQISSEYFKYEVNIRTTVFKLKITEDLSMAICIPVSYAIDYNKFNTVFQCNCTSKEFYSKRILNNLSIFEIYNYTYDGDNILYRVGYQEAERRRDSKSSNFSSIMKIQKYLFNSNICYLYSLKLFKPMRVQWIRGGNVVFLNFGNQISETYAVWLFIAGRDRIPLRENTEARYIYRGNSSTETYSYQSSHYSIRTQSLPPPYETGCFSYSERNMTDSIECSERCLVLKSFEKWGKIPSSSFVSNKAIDYKFVKMRNYTKYLFELREIRLFCQTFCPNISCDETQIVTIHERETHTNYFKNVSIAWERMTPSVPSATILCRPTSILTELILYIMSSISTWTGLSMMSINPILFLRSLSKTKVVPRILAQEHRRHRETIRMNQMDRMSQLENCLVSQSLAIEKQRLEIDKLKEMVFHSVKNCTRSVQK